MDALSTPVLLALAGFAGGVVLGLAARLGRFCTLAAFENIFYGSDYRRMRAWALAVAVAIVLVQTMAWQGILDLDQSIYRAAEFTWLSAIVGGLLFGAGMALNGTCGFGTLVRMGGGDLRALVTFLVLGISAYMMMGGVTSFIRLEFTDPVTLDLSALGAHDFAAMMDILLGTNAGALWGYLVAAVLALWALRDKGFRQRWRLVVSGVAVGLVIAWGWFATATLGADPFDPQPLASYTFVRPVGQTILYAMTFSGATIDFGVGAVVGVIAGALAGAAMRREFRWEACDDVRELRRHLSGAFLMGTGGVMSFGCTIGQGMTAASALSISTPVVFLSIALGARLGLSWLMEGSLRGLFSSLIAVRRLP
ncbi:YeeE/YedE family protein [Breoghania sp. L-A4]|uniref:YeeE/YedE family protein n=1 Tax=Breoghania sp. L-A4 TaxID=2304600 RepID=UPI000E35F230|nr:YeeE/YedE family protein [Breoghania sp. L-A4]AXS40477.1 YeeE/YedE family protein [Breoghania sp. L-A4]